MKRYWKKLDRFSLEKRKYWEIQWQLPRKKVNVWPPSLQTAGCEIIDVTLYAPKIIYYCNQLIFFIVIDGLVKRLEELERTAELYKGNHTFFFVVWKCYLTAHINDDFLEDQLIWVSILYTHAGFQPLMIYVRWQVRPTCIWNTWRVVVDCPSFTSTKLFSTHCLFKINPLLCKHPELGNSPLVTYSIFKNILTIIVPNNNYDRLYIISTVADDAVKIL